MLKTMVMSLVTYTMAFALLGCDSKQSSAGPSPAPSSPALYSLSSEVTRAAELLDRAAYSGAEAVLNKLLRDRPDDAGVYCQYTRLLILASRPAYPGNVATPMHPSESVWGAYLARQAVARAVELDPNCKRYLADLILRSFHAIATATLNEGDGIIPTALLMRDFAMNEVNAVDGHSLSMVNVCWDAITADPSASKEWASSYNELTTLAIKKGKIASAVMLGNLTGDLQQGGIGSEDFKLATQAFLACLRTYQPDGQNDWLRDAAGIYVLFKDEFDDIKHGRAKYPEFEQLEAQLAKFDVRIPRPPANPLQSPHPAGSAPQK